jgi:hypothetical protein
MEPPVSVKKIALKVDLDGYGSPETLFGLGAYQLVP